MKAILDISALLDGRIIDQHDRFPKELIIPQSVIDELEFLWQENSAVALVGLNNLKRLRASKQVQIRDGDLLDLAKAEAAVLITADEFHRTLAEVNDIPVIFLEPEIPQKLSFEQFFEPDVMSIHLKEGCKVVRKRGRPGKWLLEELETILSAAKLRRIAQESVEFAERDRRSFIEYDDASMSILQLRDYRVVIAKPPFADAFEITITRPIAQVQLKDYNLPKALINRLYKAEGIVISGSPGSGKSTFASALAHFFVDKHLVVKTLENPRDLHLPREVSQYDAREEKVIDALLLTRPDRVIFDEVRDERDFERFVELRMAGIGMVGVIHASRPIDAIQRFLGKAEMGLIPQIIDTVLFIKGGAVQKVLELRQRMKVPAGMLHEDLSRPVIEVIDFKTKRTEYEIYKFGEEAVVMNLKENYPELFKLPHRWQIQGRRVIVEGITKRQAKELTRSLKHRGLRVDVA